MFGRFTLALLASASMLPLAAHAQETPASEEIVVTANKREESIREVPQSVTAITAETFERTQASDLQDYVGRIPSMTAVGSIAEPGATTVVLRGISAAEAPPPPPPTSMKRHMASAQALSAAALR